MTDNLRLTCVVALLATAATAAVRPVSFNAPRTYPINDPNGIVTADFDGDGKSDLAVATNHSSVTILLSNGKTFSYQVNCSYQALAVGDFDGDGKLDLAVAGYNIPAVSIMLGNGDGTFQAPVRYGLLAIPVAVAVGDFNRDGKPDLAVSAGEDVSILLGSGNGT